MPLRTTHTYAVLEISLPAFQEIQCKLMAAGYGACIDHLEEDGTMGIDMNGLAVKPLKPTPKVGEDLASLLEEKRAQIVELQAQLLEALAANHRAAWKLEG